VHRRLLAVLLAAPLLLACAAPEETEERSRGTEELSLRWSGTVESQDGCEGGALWFFLEDQGDGSFNGKAYYESYDHFRKTSNVVGTVSDGRILVTESMPEEADQLPAGWRWCGANYTLAKDAQSEGSKIAGSWTSNECQCGGAATLNSAD
jgi:hypothetical protein